MNKILENVFSIKNINYHKIWTIFGIKFKFLNVQQIYLDKISLIHNEIKKNQKNNDKNFELLITSINRAFYQLKKDIDFTTYWNNSSIYNEFDKQAHLDTIRFIEETIDTTQILFLKDRWKNLEYCAKKAQKNSGLFIECGVHSGRSINHIAKVIIDRTIHGFDSFEGLPDEWNGFTMQTGDFNLNGELPKVSDNVTLHKGWFNNTLSEFLKINNKKIAFLHIDCDLYQSTIEVLNAVLPYLMIGTVIVFDEFFNYPNWRNHEFKAFSEFIEKTGIEFKYISIGHLQVGIEIINMEGNK